MRQALWQEYRNLWADISGAPRWSDKLRYLLLAPGWHHAGPDKRARVLRRQQGLSAASGPA